MLARLVPPALVAALALLLAAAAGCTGAGEPAGTATPTSTTAPSAAATPAATDTPTVTATSTATPTPTPTLTAIPTPCGSAIRPGATEYRKVPSYMGLFGISAARRTTASRPIPPNMAPTWPQLAEPSMTGPFRRTVPLSRVRAHRTGGAQPRPPPAHLDAASEPGIMIGSGPTPGRTREEAASRVGGSHEAVSQVMQPWPRRRSTSLSLRTICSGVCLGLFTVMSPPAHSFAGPGTLINGGLVSRGQVSCISGGQVRPTVAAASNSEPASRLSRGTRASTMRPPRPCYSSVSTKYRPAGLAGSGR